MLDVIFSPSCPSYSTFYRLISLVFVSFVFYLFLPSFLLSFLNSRPNIQGPFIGILGFSQGATMAATLTSLLEKNNKSNNQIPTNQKWPKINHPPVNFFIAVSGFRWDFRK